MPRLSREGDAPDFARRDGRFMQYRCGIQAGGGGVESWLSGSLGDSFGPFDICEADKKDVPFFFAYERGNRIHISDSTFHFGGDANFLQQTGSCRLSADRTG